MRRNCCFSFFLFFFFSFLCSAQAQVFPLVTKDQKVAIVYSKEAPALDSIAAHLLAHDIQRVTSYKPTVVTDLAKAAGNVIIIGSVHSRLVQQFAGTSSSLVNQLKGQWECYALKVVAKPLKGVAKALIIAGSDPRGTAYGVFALSEKIGVSPWYWWADVPVKKQKTLIINQADYISSTPSVKYRGIFINDEDWGLQPWAAKTFEPETGDIGPKTYAKVFELLLRLKANLIWPAMHPSTKAFFHYPGNQKVAADYSIVIGSSHAEPMLRNNVGEWNEKTMGHFNYLTNKEKVYQYWEDRVKKAVNNEAIYSLGMRGVHDSGMEGVKNAKEAIPLLERIFKDQRDLLVKYSGKEVTAVPQAFTAYKEVLEIYDKGLQVPDDVTLVWPDDNYGYIQRLNTEEEKKRSGGAGVYYHASYWGRPHDYLWLSSTHPSLIREEMMKAYETGANRLWVLNVGDIKPLEYNIQLFMDMALNASAFKESGSVRKHLEQWVSKQFGNEKAENITGLLWQYYGLAFERRPEFMGWSQTEPTTKVSSTAYNHFHFGDEAQKRIDKYEALEKAARVLRNGWNGDEEPAFYQLVYYPLVGASWMNKKFLYRDKANLYAGQNRISAHHYAAASNAVYDSIVKETAFFNEQLSGGKWKGMMSMKPRDLPVFGSPGLASLSLQKGSGWEAVPEGYDTVAYNKNLQKDLPLFTGGLPQSFFIDIFLTDSAALQWRAKPSADWIRLSALKGSLSPSPNQSSIRLWVSIDWKKAPALAQQKGVIEVSANGRKTSIGVHLLQPSNRDFAKYKGFVEENGFVSIHASNYSGKVDQEGSRWQILQGLGHTDASLQSVVRANFLNGPRDTASLHTKAAQVSYTFYTFSTGTPKLAVYTLPTHPLNKEVGMRYAISVDDSPLEIVEFKTVGRSEEWKQNVLRNAAIKEIDLPNLQPGKHTLKIYAIDPGVVLDRILIRFGSVPRSYSVVPETRKN